MSVSWYVMALALKGIQVDTIGRECWMAIDGRFIDISASLVNDAGDREYSRPPSDVRIDCIRVLLAYN